MRHIVPNKIDEYVVEVFEDKKGNLWFGTLSKGTARYDARPNDSSGRGIKLTTFLQKTDYLVILL